MPVPEALLILPFQIPTLEPDQGSSQYMTLHSLSRAASRRPSPSLLASAITGTLLAAIAVPALASPTTDVLQRYQQQRAEQSVAFARDLHSASLAATFVALIGANDQTVSFTSPRTSAEAAGPILGKPGDVESWHSDEFNADWGLAAMGADYAYARGLTGQNRPAVNNPATTTTDSAPAFRPHWQHA